MIEYRIEGRDNGRLITTTSIRQIERGAFNVMEIHHVYMEIKNLDVYVPEGYHTVKYCLEQLDKVR